MASCLPLTDSAYYVILFPASAVPLPESLVSEAAGLLQLKPADMNRILAVGDPAPVSRLSSSAEARAQADALHNLGIESAIVTSNELHLDQAPVKVYALEFSDNALTGLVVGSAARISVAWDEVALLVSGRLHLSRVEVKERKRRKRKETVGSHYFSADESVLDFYPENSTGNWRMRAANFDFSCLGPARSITAFENFATLIAQLQLRATHAQFDCAYGQARTALEIVWPVEPQTTRGDWRRTGAGRIDTATVTTIDNEAQFTRYSRLRYCLRKRQ
jgi:hypothetical protein